ncbi:MAG: FHA domain-containing protein [Pseudomonadota bacterium]
MLDKLFAKALTLQIADEPISFATLAEFEFALSGRTNVPATKIADLMLLNADDLKREAKNIKRVEKRFVEILSNSIENPGAIRKLVGEVDVQVFSNDHDWREIFKALNREGDEYDELRRVAVVKYMQYLRSRQDVIKQTYKLKHKAEPMIAEPSPDQTVMNPMEETKDFLKETNIFDAMSLDPNAENVDEFTRIPKGEAVKVTLSGDQTIEVKLSKHPFKLNFGAMEFIDENGAVYRLGDGKNIIGRDSVCNVCVDNSLRDVSRMHLIIEPLDSGETRFTDLSSHGTFIPSFLLPEQGFDD